MDYPEASYQEGQSQCQSWREGVWRSLWEMSATSWQGSRG